MAHTEALFTASRQLARLAKKKLQQDMDHLVVLDADFFAGTLRETFDWHGRALRILPWDGTLLRIDEERRLTVKSGTKPFCDGATLAPDTLLGVDVACGYITHDAWYQEMDAMAADERWSAEGWTLPALRALGDLTLGRAIEYEERRLKKPGLVSRLYYRAVRLFGGIYHAAAKCRVATESLALALAFALAAGGCGGGCGCAAVPDAGFDPSGETPFYHVEVRSNG